MKARLVWLILCGIWGSTWLFIKLGLADLPPLSFAGIRVVGVAIIFSDRLTIAGKGALLGSVALVLSALCGSYGNVLVKAYGTQIDPFVLAAGQMVCGFPPLLAVGIAAEGNPFRFHWTSTAMLGLTYLVIIGSVIAFTLFYWLGCNTDVLNTLLI